MFFKHVREKKAERKRLQIENYEKKTHSAPSEAVNSNDRLSNALWALKASVCLFIRNFDVPFDNNQAERDVRNIKTKTKVSGCFRTESGAQDYLDIMSYISTGRKHGVSAYEALTAAFAGNAEIVLR